MTMGVAGQNGARNPIVEERQGVIDVFLGRGHTELNTTRNDTTEEMTCANWNCPAQPLIPSTRNIFRASK
ncbi:hypothetical protein HYDPIDRAFT_112473 [Hydnomerulius pinastri MD-312]|uniref:Uncharacterized protein n=1 Tax=Hydnomerulius pinastri MD-312 TaxID=994086 RepID=A0A0C9WF74_9AGAM|nr:hypothetical protein HYDPIDRAFT_112473 [Hydnomerulius pinastri MD-312]